MLFELSVPIFLPLYRYLCQKLNRDVVSEIFALVLRLPIRGGEGGGGLIGSETALKKYLRKELFYEDEQELFLISNMLFS